MRKVLSEVAKSTKRGTLTAQAAREGKTPKEFCRTKHTGKAAKRCALMHTFDRYRPGKKRHGGSRGRR